MSDPGAGRKASETTLTVEPGPVLDALAAAFRHAMIGIAIGGPDGRLRDANPALLRMLGYERHELQDLHIADITYADDQEGDAAQWARLASGEVDAYQREKRYLRKDGTVLWGLVTVSALRDESGAFLGSSAQIQDITAQKLAEAALRENEARLEALVGQLPVVLYSQPWGGRHAIHYVSPRFEQLTGLRLEDIPTNHHDYITMVHPDDRALVREIDVWADRTGETAHAEYRLLGGNGEWVWVDHQSVLMRDEQGRPVAWHGSLIDISERKRLEASLRESDVRFRRAFEDSAIGMAIGTPDDICVDANDAYCRMVGVPREELIGRSFETVTYPDDREDQARRLAQLIRGEADSFVVEKRYLRPDGEVITGLVTISAVRDDAGALLYCVGQILDVTAQKATEAALSESEELLRSIIERAPAAVYRLEPGTPGPFTFASPHFKTLTGLSIADNFTKISDFFQRVHPGDLPMLRAADAEAARTGEPFDAEYRVRGDDGSWIWVHDRSSPARDAQGRIVAWHGVLIDISERKRLQEALRENEERLQVLVGQLPAALFSLEAGSTTRYAYVSPQFSALTGMTPDDIARGTEALFEHMHPDDAERVRESDRRSYETEEPHEVEYRVWRADGEWVWLQERAMLARDSEGRPLAWHGVLLDISEQRKAEAALSESAQHGQALIASALDAVIEMDGAGQIIEFNPAAERTFGYRREEALGRFLAELIIPPGLHAAHREGLKRYLATGEGPILGQRREMTAQRADGREFPAELTVTALTGGDDPKFVGFVRDISDRHAIETALRASEARFRSAFEGAGIGMSLADLDGRFFDANPAFCDFLGYDRDELLKLTYLDITHPDDRGLSQAYTRQLFKDGFLGFSLEKRYVRADGRTVWGQLTITTVRDAEGKPSYEIAQVQDITARKEAEAALLESESRFRSTFESAGIGMTLVNADGRFFDANPAFCRFIGYSREELLKLTSLEITHPDDRLFSQQALRQLVNRDFDAFSTEKRYVRADGRTVWGDLTITAMRNPDDGAAMVIGQVQDISARKEAEAARRESEARFQSIFEDAGIGMAITTPGGKIELINPVLAQLLGYSPEELIGDQIQELTYPDDLEVQEVFRRRTRAGEIDGYLMEKRYLGRDGGIVWGLLSVSAVRNERGEIESLIGQVQDISARKEAEAALQESEARFRALVQNDPDVIMIIDEAMNATYVSPSSVTAFGAMPHEVMAAVDGAMERIHPEDLERTLTLLNEVRDHPGAVTSTEARIRHADQGWRWFHISIANLLDDPGVKGYLINLREITERKHAEIATAAALKTQQAAIAELERLNRTKSRFLSTISHEFRTPLTAIIGYSEFMANNAANPSLIAEDAEVIHREASRLNRMVDDVLLLDRVDARRIALNVKTIDINAIVQDVVETCRPLLEMHTLVLDLDPALRAIEGDRDRLAQALTNLVSNGIKYSPTGGTIAIATRNEGDGVLVSVRDEGIGIAADDLSRIFDRFERIETGIAGRIAGTGLGLSIVQEIANLHGGRVWVESEPGFGSIFFLALPGKPPTLARSEGK